MTTTLNERVESTVSHASRDALLRLSDVSVTYDGEHQAVLENIHFTLYEGETVLFLGPSGGGKSTLAMLIANLIPTSVEATVSGNIERDLRLMEPGSIGYVFQDPDAQFCMIHAGDEIAFGMENHRIPSVQMNDRIQVAQRELESHFDLSSIHANYSGGMKQKLAILGALAMDAQLLIFDEPTANLDPLATRVVFEEIRRLREGPKTLLVIEHKFDALLPMVDRVVLFNRKGHIHRIGEPREVFSAEWAWLIEQGIVSRWKKNPYEQSKVAVEDEMALWQSHTAHSASGRRTTLTDAAFSLTNASLSFAHHSVWSDVSLDIPAGSFTAIVGPNGSGKSSLLQVLAGLTKLSQGEAEILGRPAKKWNKQELAKAVSYCFQNPEYQFIYHTVADELANQYLGEVSPPPDVAALMEEFGLKEHATHSPFGLSQGQKRRLSVACMVRDDHSAYLLDEPTFGQDAQTEYAIMERLNALHQAGNTVIMTTHNMELVAKYATQVVVVCDRAVLYSGSVAGLLNDRALLIRAHLYDDVMLTSSESGRTVPTSEFTGDVQNKPITSKRRPAPVTYLNAPWQMLTCMVAVIVVLFAHTIWQSLAEFCIPLVFMVGLAWQSPLKIVKRFSPFVIFYVLYVLAVTLNAKPIPGTLSYSFLWWHFSLPNLVQALVLAVRMLAVVGYTILFFMSADITDFIVGLSKNFHLPPKFAYGILAGLRVIPLFQTEWTKLKQARQLRGQQSRVIFRPVTYALPLFSQAIRMSERVAIAMEARGLYGEVAERSTARTFYRDVTVRWWDYAYFIGVLAFTLVGILVF